MEYFLRLSCFNICGNKSFLFKSVLHYFPNLEVLTDGIGAIFHFSFVVIETVGTKAGKVVGVEGEFYMVQDWLHHRC